jgi:membrane protein YqaA with SNARE-associated domain
MKNWHRKLHVWSLLWAKKKWGAWALFICAFADASFLPLPTQMFFLALVLLNITNAYKFALFGTLGTLFGAVAGYAIGYFAWLNAEGGFTGLANFLFNHVPGFSVTGYNNIHVLYAKWDFWILFIAAFMPLPYKIFSISSGVFDINVFIFCIATLISQGIKFFLIAQLTIRLGPEIKKLLSFNWKPVAIIATACVALIFIVFKVF